MSFEVQLDRFLAKTRIAPAVAVRKLTLDTLLEVLNRSPVDTGRFRANWRVAAGSPDRRTDDSTRPADPAALVAPVFSTPGLIPEEVWISNNLPYALPLERGHSSQQPAGVVRPAVDAILAQFRGL